MLDLTRYRHVIWDWNGTLLDDVDCARGVVDRMLRRRGLPGLTRERYQENFRFPIQDYYAAVGFDFAVDPFPELALEFHADYAPRSRECVLQPHTIETLQHLRQTGIGQSVLSAAEQTDLERHIEFFGLGHYFTHLVGIDDQHGGSKELHGQRWLTQLPHGPTEVVLVGDTKHDVDVAEALGVDCVLVANGHQPRGRLEQCGAPIVDRLDQLWSPR